MQKTLSARQIEAFYHDEFVEDQARHFASLLGDSDVRDRLVIDVGGGVGHFAKRLTGLLECRVRVLDTDAASVEACRGKGLEAIRGDALNPTLSGDESIVSFNLILHHLVGATEQRTLELQRRALEVWRPFVRSVFVNEYIYESYLDDLSGRLIFHITKSRALSWMAGIVSKVVPAFRANTFGVGVRFRAHDEWRRVFASAGYDVKASVTGDEELIALPLRLLLIRQIRRDSFLLQPTASRST
jgi:hypothetical protein